MYVSILYIVLVIVNMNQLQIKVIWLFYEHVFNIKYMSQFLY